MQVRTSDLFTLVHTRGYRMRSTNETRALMALCRKVQAHRGPMPTDGTSARTVRSAMAAGLVHVVNRGGGALGLVTTEAGYLMSRAVCIWDAEEALRVPELLGLA